MRPPCCYGRHRSHVSVVFPLTWPEAPALAPPQGRHRTHLTLWHRGPKWASERPGCLCPRKPTAPWAQASEVSKPAELHLQPWVRGCEPQAARSQLGVLVSSPGHPGQCTGGKKAPVIRVTWETPRDVGAPRQQSEKKAGSPSVLSWCQLTGFECSDTLDCLHFLK